MIHYFDEHTEKLTYIYIYRAKKKIFQTLFLSQAKFEQIWPTYAVKFKTGNIEHSKIYILCSRIEKICSKSITD